jgi:uncharacterized sulfatase
MGAGSALPLRGHKTNLYEGGIRSPLIVWGPAFLEESKRGATNEDNYFCALDIPRSLANIAGVKVSNDVGLDGEDVSATLLGLQRRSRTMPIYWRRPPDRPGTKHEDYPDLAMREGRWKLLCEYDGSDPQLYDLVADRSETTNLAEAQKEIVMKMFEKLAEWNQAMPVDRGAELESELAEN